jgi:hypothetical protein
MIRLTDLRYGPGYFQQPGAVLNLTPDEERALIAAGRAVSVETATKAIPETATAHKGKYHGKSRPSR